MARGLLMLRLCNIACVDRFNVVHRKQQTAPAAGSRRNGRAGAGAEWPDLANSVKVDGHPTGSCGACCGRAYYDRVGGFFRLEKPNLSFMLNRFQLSTCLLAETDTWSLAAYKRLA